MSRTSRRRAIYERKAKHLTALIAEADKVADGMAVSTSTPKCGWEKAAKTWRNELDAMQHAIKLIDEKRKHTKDTDNENN